VTGSFGDVSPGCSAADLEALFGPPEATGGQSRRRRRSTIWKYGDPQFFFEWPGGLQMVHIDTFFGPDRKPKGWGGLQLDPWCIRAGLPIAEFLSPASDVQCAWQVRNEPVYDRDVVVLASGVEVGFAHKEEFDPIGGLFGLWRKWCS
jgi:hypothetical protein